jgi:hypothetical protein
MEVFVPTAEGMIIADAFFISTARTTICDIMCTTNTTNISHSGAKGKMLPNSKPMLAVLPYEKMKTLVGPYKATTRIQKIKIDNIMRQKMDDLRRDRDAFYYELLRERDELNALKNQSATVIQATFRGFCARPRNHSYIPQKKNIIVHSQHDMHDELCNLAAMLNLKPIPGLSLEARSKASKRRLRIENAAAYRVQRFFRMIGNRKLALVVIRAKIKENQNNSARIITRAVRFVITKKFVTTVEIIKRERSAVIIQSYVRMFQGRER